MHDHAHRGHAHHSASRDHAARRLSFALALTGAYLIVEVIAGFWTGSLALLADAGHMLTDAGGLALSLVAIHLARRPATPERTYGLYRAEILAALGNGVVLIGTSALIGYEAYGRLINPPAIETGPMLLVAVVGLAVNIAGVFALRESRDGSLNVQGAYLELLSDAVASAGVIAAAVVMRLTGWYYADPIVSIAIALYILPRTLKLLREAVDILLEGTPSNINLVEVRQAMESVDGVAGVHDLHVWSLTSGVNALSAHVVRAASGDFEALLDRIHGSIRTRFPIQHVTVQLEPVGWQCRETHL